MPICDSSRSERSRGTRNYDILCCSAFQERQQILTKHTFLAVPTAELYRFSIKNIWRLYFYISLKTSLSLALFGTSTSNFIFHVNEPLSTTTLKGFYRSHREVWVNYLVASRREHSYTLICDPKRLQHSKYFISLLSLQKKSLVSF